MFRQNPEVKAFFNPANQFADPPLQRLALGNAVVAYASNIDDLTPLAGAVEDIVHKHCGLTVLPEHYPVVHKNLMESIAHVLGPDVVTEEIGQGWSQGVLSLAEILYTREEEVYQAAADRRGGWRGTKDFRVTKKRQVAEGSIEFTFEAVDGAGPIDFTPGQFLTLHLRKEGATPRHYTVTNKPGEPYLQCCVKSVKDGFVSNAMHSLQEGEIVGLVPPFGTFALTDSPMVLLSAGIGVTPMKSFLAAAPHNVRLALHVDRSPASHPFKEEFSAVPIHFHYTEESGCPSPKALVEGVLKPHLADCDFYLCGPPAWLDGMKSALLEGGAKGVRAERFGPALA
jgi:nitric oxide dioxygenase